MSAETPVEPVESPVEPVESPILRVVKGALSAEELAALVAVVTARSAAAAIEAANAKPKLRSEWGHPARAVRTAHVVGPDAWHRSAFAR